MKTNRFASYGLEDADVVIPGEEVDPTIDSSQAAETAAVDEAAAVDAVAADIDTLEGASEDLQSICVGLAQMTRNGGVPRAAASFALNHADRVLASVGLEGVRVSVEDFEEDPEAVELPPVVEPDADPADPAILGIQAEKVGAISSESVRVGLEAMADIKAKMKQIWEAIKAAIKSFAKKVRDFMLKVFDYFNRVGKTAEKMKAKLQALKDVTTKKDEIELGGLRESFVVGTSLATVADVEKVGKYLRLEAVNAQLQDAKKFQTDLAAAKTAQAILSAVATAEASLKPEEAAKMLSFKPVSGGRSVSDVLPGNVVFYSSYGTGDGDNKHYSVSYGVEKNGKDQKGPEKVAAPSKEDLIKYCDAVIDLAKRTLDFRAVIGKVDRQNDEMIRAVDKRVGEISSDDKEESRALQRASQIVSGKAKAAYGIQRMLSSGAFTVGRNANKFVSLGYKNFKAAPAVEEEKKAA